MFIQEILETINNLEWKECTVELISGIQMPKCTIQPQGQLLLITDGLGKKHLVFPDKIVRIFEYSII